MANHAQRTVVQVDDLHRHVVLQAGRKLLNVHLDTAFTGNTGNRGLREVLLHAHGRRKTEAHGAQAAGVDPAIGLVEAIVLGRKHLMLPNVGGNEGVATRHFPQRLDNRLRLDDAAVALVVREQVTITTPFVDLLPPGGLGIGIRAFTHLLIDSKHFCQYAFNRANNRNIGLDGLGNRRRIDIDMDDLGVRAELAGVIAIDDTVIKACTDGQDHVCVMHGQVGGVAAVHAKHTDELTIGTRISTQPHQGVGHRQVERARQFSQRARGTTKNDATTGVHDRTLGFEQHFYRFADLTGMTTGSRIVGAQLDLLRVAVLELVGRVGHVLGNVDHNRTGTTALRQIEGLFDDLRNVARVLDHEAVLHDRTGNANHVGFLEGIGANHVAHNLAGNNDHWDRVHVGRRNTGNGIGRTRAGRHQYHTRLAGSTGVAVCHVGSSLLVTDQNMLYVVLPENGIVDMQKGTTRVPVDIFNTLVTQ